MLTDTQSKLWNDYLELEKNGLRSQLLNALELFIQALQTDKNALKEWVYDICARYVDQGENLPVRIPLFQKIIFPILWDGAQNNKADCFRWLAGFNQLIYSLTPIQKIFGDTDFHETALLRKALFLNPDDQISREKLVRAMAYQLEYSLHELPSGILYSQDGATADECLLLLVELEEFITHAQKCGLEQEYAELIQNCQTHFNAFLDYLQNIQQYQSYQEYCTIKEIIY